MVKNSLGISTPLSTALNTDKSVIYTPSSIPSTPILPARPPSPEKTQVLPGDSSRFLTALAGQERRVLELREELKIAELELEKLKKQWALHETSKKRNEIRQLEPLQTINKPTSKINFPELGSHGRVKKEQEGRRATLVTTRHSQRKVFSGSRHTRTLSLLSPTSISNQTIPSVPLYEMKKSQKSEKDGPRSGIAFQTMFPVIAPSDAHISSTINTMHEPPKDDILETGKQLVGDLREGLWTFFEDLKQATVGDEAASSPGPRNSSLAHPVQPVRKQTSIYRGNSNRKDIRSEPTNLDKTICDPKPKPQSHRYFNKVSQQGPSRSVISNKLSTPAIESLQQSQQRSVKIAESDDDGWDNWDSPPPKDPPTARWSSSTAITDSIASPLTEKSSPRTSIRYFQFHGLEGCGSR